MPLLRDLRNAAAHSSRDISPADAIDYFVQCQRFNGNLKALLQKPSSAS
jgi:hypothetical protein